MEKLYIEKETVEKEIKRKLFGNCSFCAVSATCYSRKGTHRNCWTMPKFSVSDAVEVVRCKDCRRCLDMQNPNTAGRLMCNITMFEVQGNDFCSFGERRTNDAEIH